MALYCDNVKLEYNWYCWLVARACPVLEQYRSMGLLWTRVAGSVLPRTVGDQVVLDHCIAIGHPIWLQSVCSVLVDAAALPGVSECDWGLMSDDVRFKLEDPYFVQGKLVPELLGAGYKLDIAVATAWAELISEISKICAGVSRKFKLSEEDGCELAQEALTQVMRKLVIGKLWYEPGRAPVFNLLTTTVHRCMYSILNKTTKYRTNINKLTYDVINNNIINRGRSLRVTI